MNACQFFATTALISSIACIAAAVRLELYARQYREGCEELKRSVGILQERER